MEREHSKEKQKLVKDKDAGEHLPWPHVDTLLKSITSKGPVNQGESNQGQDGESRSRAAEGIVNQHPAFLLAIAQAPALRITNGLE
jgi:hypothetical protein